MKTKRMKTIILLAVVLSMKSILLVAQPHDGHQGPPPIPDAIKIKEMVNHLSTDLSLSTEQTDQFSKIFTEHFKEVKAKLEAEKIAREKHHQEMDKLRSTFEDQLNKLLNPEQQKKFVEFQKTHHPVKDEHRKPE